jgi:hypothetical protein
MSHAFPTPILPCFSMASRRLADVDDSHRMINYDEVILIVPFEIVRAPVEPLN